MRKSLKEKRAWFTSNEYAEVKAQREKDRASPPESQPTQSDKAGVKPYESMMTPAQAEWGYNAFIRWCRENVAPGEKLPTRTQYVPLMEMAMHPFKCTDIAKFHQDFLKKIGE